MHPRFQIQTFTVVIVRTYDPRLSHVHLTDVVMVVSSNGVCAYEYSWKSILCLKDIHGNMHMMVPKRIRFARDKESEYVEFRTETDGTHNYTLHIK